jgi:hypothetical protein
MVPVPQVAMMTFDFTCGACQSEYEAPVFLGGYGEFVARSSRGTLAHVNALEDPVFEEVQQLAEAAITEMGAQLSAPVAGSIVQAAFAVACDPDPGGGDYVIGAHPPCPRCGSQVPSEWVETGAVVPTDVPPTSHSRWSALSPEARHRVVYRAVADACSS